MRLAMQSNGGGRHVLLRWLSLPLALVGQDQVVVESQQPELVPFDLPPRRV